MSDKYLEEIDNMDFTPSDWCPEDSIIKVIGVGGGGCNAVNYMYHQRIQGCTFLVCNTDAQALENCDVPIKIQLGEGLGAGCDPTKGRNAALNSQDEIAEKALTGTEMLFITAGMGGGTGTGAAPVIAAMAKKKGILTVGVVTLPFHNEGQDSLAKAVDGINELEKNVDSLLIINNEKLYAYYGDLLIQDAFPKADEVLATAVRGITEIIKKRGHINVDFNDVKAMMKNSGMALMGCGTGTGENRLEDAVKNALESPLLNDFDPTTAKNVLINITVGRNERGVKMTQLEQINALIKEYTGDANNFKSGIVFDDDPDFGDRVNITVIATGFKGSVLDSMVNVKLGNIIWVDQDFVYERGQTDSEEIELPEVRSHRIGYNNTVVRKKNIFADGEKPVLLVEEAQSLSDLENVPAIRRRANPHSRTEE
ncbi:MAG: cell division protein FtsZ [Bacteroidales bacterium]|nr:cell division protein FtsZ [Bacteroidales bacterium]MDD5891071.1 cell division protein FtsZ [Bacteroidales bacterium]MDY5358048.1 cell division protein FtsZ [Candidatus Cryptobacteroides sp.]